MRCMSRTTAGILVVEDDETIRRSLDVALRRVGYAVRAEPDGTKMAEALANFRPDLAILDVRLPVGPNGFAIARQLQSNQPGLPILFLTAADGLRDRLEGFEAGGDDYLSKPYETAELLARVKALLRRLGRPADPVWRAADLVVDDATRTVTRAGKELKLTATEYKLLAMLCLHQGQILTKEQLLTEVWGYDAYDPNVVYVHMVSLRRKLEAHGPRLVHTVRSFGYVLRP